MNKGDLITSISQEAKISKISAKKTIDSLLNSIRKSLKKGEPVTLIGFGTFNVARRKAKVFRSPQNGKIMLNPSKKVPVFKPGKDLRINIINQNKGL